MFDAVAKALHCHKHSIQNTLRPMIMISASRKKLNGLLRISTKAIKRTNKQLLAKELKQNLINSQENPSFSVKSSLT
jgi:hypothetical protein